MFSFFNELPLITKQNFEFMYRLICGERLLSAVVGGVSFLAEKRLDFLDTILSVSPSLFKVYWSGGKITLCPIIEKVALIDKRT